MTTIRIAEETKKQLDSIKEPGESYNSVLHRIFNIPLTPRQFSRLRNLKAANRKKMEQLNRKKTEELTDGN